MILQLHPNIAYYHAPKNASRTMCAWAALLKFPNLLQDHPEYFEESRKQDYPEIRNTNIEYPASRHHWQNPTKVPQVDAPVRIAIVRDPVKRFISAYTNRVVYHNCMRSMPAYRQNPPTITQFIDNIDSFIRDNKQVDVHVRAQYHFFGSRPEMFTHIFNTSQMAQVKSLIETTAGVTLPDLYLQKNGDCEKPTVTAEQDAFLRERYRIDYALYGRWF